MSNPRPRINEVPWVDIHNTIVNGLPGPDVSAFVLNINLNDTPNTIKSVIEGLPENCVGVTVAYTVGRECRNVARRAAWERGIYLYFSNIDLLFGGDEWEGREE